MLSRADTDAARAAKQVQEHAPTWWVIWSLRFRRFEAWECTDPVRCRTVHAAGAGQLWDHMQQVDLDLWRIRPRIEEPADRAPVDDVPQVARRVAGRLGKHYVEPTAPP
ncbi:hypothetical protein [Streptosporangium sp. NPDC002524]|uniref:hypothetical protein n=1 Tax=Streptosporangium sp. NPDC002524 TaxID=3154537 RepID=UPI00331C6A04